MATNVPTARQSAALKTLGKAGMDAEAFATEMWPDTMNGAGHTERTAAIRQAGNVLADLRRAGFAKQRDDDGLFVAS